MIIMTKLFKFDPNNYKNYSIEEIMSTKLTGNEIRKKFIEFFVNKHNHLTV